VTSSPCAKTPPQPVNHCLDTALHVTSAPRALIKGSITGIVSIGRSPVLGCQYCILACPYEVPKYSAPNAESFATPSPPDMCQSATGGRRSSGLSQAWPHEEIRIADSQRKRTSPPIAKRTPFCLVPRTRRNTQPTTNYKSRRPFPGTLGQPNSTPLFRTCHVPALTCDRIRMKPGRSRAMYHWIRADPCSLCAWIDSANTVLPVPAAALWCGLLALPPALASGENLIGVSSNPGPTTSGECEIVAFGFCKLAAIYATAYGYGRSARRPPGSGRWPERLSGRNGSVSVHIAYYPLHTAAVGRRPTNVVKILADHL